MVITLTSNNIHAVLQNINDIKNITYNDLTGICTVITLDGKSIEEKVDCRLIKNLVSIGMDIEIYSAYEQILKTRNIIVNTALILSLLTLTPQARNTIGLLLHGVDIKIAMDICLFDIQHTSDELVKYISRTEEKLRELYPDIKFSNDTVLKDEKVSSIVVKDIKDPIAGIFDPDTNTIVVEQRWSYVTVHEEIHRKSKHIKNGITYVGFRKLYTIDKRATAITEGMTDYIKNKLEPEYKYDPNDYLESYYIDMLTSFMPEKEMVKIFFEGSTQELEELLIQYGDKDNQLIKMLDKDHGKHKNVEGIGALLTDMFLYTVINENWDPTDKSRIASIENFIFHYNFLARKANNNREVSGDNPTDKLRVLVQNESSFSSDTIVKSPHIKQKVHHSSPNIM